MRAYATDAQRHLRSEFGDDFDHWREPLQQLNELRGFDPRRAVTSYLLDDNVGEQARSQSPAPRQSSADNPHTALRPQQPGHPGDPVSFDRDAT